MARILAIMNQKGGVGKTTTSLNLGAALSTHGKRVLLVDLDPQANLTLGLGLQADDLSQSVYELLTDAQVKSAGLVMKTKWPNLDLIPSHIDLSGADLEMVTMIGRETRLAKALGQIAANYEYIIIDCLPSLSLLTVNAMAAASEILVPLQAHPFALKGLGKLFEVSGMIRQEINPALRVSGVLLTMFDGRTNVAKTTLDVLRADTRLAEHIFSTTVKQNIKVAESQKEGIPVVFFDTQSHAAKAYQALALEVLEMETGCVASKCAERITAREVKAGEDITFTPDLLAPPQQPGGSDPEKKKTARDTGTLRPAAHTIPEEPHVHVAPVNALVSAPSQASAPNAEILAPQVEAIAPQIEATTAPTPLPIPPNTPDVETLHPSTPHGIVINARG